jgi:hypothetical protein
MLDPNQIIWTQIAAGVCVRLRGQIEASKAWQKIEGKIIASG